MATAIDVSIVTPSRRNVFVHAVNEMYCCPFLEACSIILCVCFFCCCLVYMKIVGAHQDAFFSAYLFAWREAQGRCLPPYDVYRLGKGRRLAAHHGRRLKAMCVGCSLTSGIHSIRRFRGTARDMPQHVPRHSDTTACRGMSRQRPRVGVEVRVRVRVGGAVKHAVGLRHVAGSATKNSPNVHPSLTPAAYLWYTWNDMCIDVTPRCSSTKGTGTGIGERMCWTASTTTLCV